MAKYNHPRRFILIIITGLMVILTSALLTLPVQAGEKQQETETYCLSCHSNPDLSMELPSGEKLSLYISADVIGQSVHSPVGIECEACHTDIKIYPHPELKAANLRELTRTYYMVCEKCHTSNYEKSLDSMHAKVATEGNLAAPVCTDCHGAHDVRQPDQPRGHISETCGKCHTEIADAYKQSIHGGALIQDDNPDVPVCTDCHGVHNIQDPRTTLFHVQSPELCAHCHADQELMAKYNLPANVYNIYKLSWHGVDVSVYKANWPTIEHSSAVCTDCHGIHNILSTDDPASSVNPTNLLATCQKCHPGVSPNWTSAWTGHNEVSLEKTPFVFYTQAFYSSLTPTVLWALGIYVALQILRATVGRVRRSL